ncbi:MAG: bifunctional folylpolyglutamate synthase/dihydrofolate synthase [Gemmatimonadota bacterium]
MLTAALHGLLEGRPPTRIRWGLDRIRALLDGLGNPERGFRCVHVGGTNGKGSVAVTCEALLREAGLRTGLYTSPHLIEFAERIRIDGVIADPRLLDREAQRLTASVRDVEASFFEAATALAVQAFDRAGVEVAVLEVGLGGRLDATNVVSPDVTVITNVAADHADLLGGTVREVASEKAGIIKAQTPVVLGPMDREAETVCLGRARALEASAHRYGEAFRAEDVRVLEQGTSFRYRSPDTPRGFELTTRLVGRHQAENAALALRAVELLRPLARDATRRALERIDWPGRAQRIRTPEGAWLLDLAHNPAGAAALAATLDELPFDEPLVVLAAILGDKDWEAMLGPLLRRAVGAVFTVAPSSPAERRWDPAAAAASVGDVRPLVESSFRRAMARARELAGGGTVLVTGSCHTVGDALLRLTAGAGIDRTETEAEAKANAV